MAQEIERSVHLTTQMVRALAHPLRSKLLKELRLHGASTSTRLAERIGTNTGATSYHLRQLGEAGLVEEDETLGNQRERWWRALHEKHSWLESDHAGDPEAMEAADWLIRSAHREYARQVDSWLDVRDEWPVAWRDAADQSDFIIEATASQLAELNERVQRLVEEYSRGDNHPEEEKVAILYYSFPLRAVSE